MPKKKLHAMAQTDKQTDMATLNKLELVEEKNLWIAQACTRLLFYSCTLVLGISISVSGYKRVFELEHFLRFLFRLDGVGLVDNSPSTE